MIPSHYISPEGLRSIQASNRAVIERNNQLRNERTLREFQRQQGEPVRAVPAYRVPTLMRVCK